jgi:predicted amidohydrolase
MKIYGLQTDISWEDKSANFDKVRRLLDAAQPERGSLVVLPEMFATGFSMKVERIAEEREGETAAFLSRTAKECGVYLLGGFATAGPEGKGLNEAAVMSPEGREIARYCKMHPFSYGGEARHYLGGERPRLFDWQGIRVAPFICYDLRFPEVFRSAALDGAQLYAVIANWPQAREHHWRTLLQARAIENQACVIGVNRVGHDPKIAYSGGSLIVGPRGEILADGGSAEGVLSADIDKEDLLRYRAEFPALADIRREYVARPIQ